MRKLVLAVILAAMGGHAIANAEPSARSLPIIDGLAAAVLTGTHHNLGSIESFSPKARRFSEIVAQKRSENLSKREALGAEMHSDKYRPYSMWDAQRKISQEIDDLHRQSDEIRAIEGYLTAIARDKTAADVVTAVKKNDGWGIWLMLGQATFLTHNSTPNNTTVTYVTNGGVNGWVFGQGLTVIDHLSNQQWRQGARRELGNAYNLNSQNNLILSSDRIYGARIFNSGDLQYFAKRRVVGFNFANPTAIENIHKYRIGIKGRLIDSVPTSSATRTVRIDDRSLVLIDEHGKIVGDEIRLDSQHIVWRHNEFTFGGDRNLDVTCWERISTIGTERRPGTSREKDFFIESMGIVSNGSKAVEANAFEDIVAQSSTCKNRASSRKLF